MANAAYNRGKFVLLGSSLDLLADDIRILLVQSSYAFDATDNVVTDVSGDEVSVVGYARQTLGSKTITEDDANSRAEFDAANIIFSALAAGQVVGGAILFKDTGADATSPLVAFFDTPGFPQATNGGGITLTWDVEGILQLT